MSSRAIAGLIAFALSLLPGAVRADFIPPPQKPERIKGAEGFPPLPLPVVPMRRTERKHPPSPPTLVSKIVWGGDYEIAAPDGRKVVVPDWNSDPADLDQLVERSNAKLGIWYGDATLRLKGFSGEPAETPILYANGHRPFQLEAEEKAVLKAYLERGGFLWAQACCGRPEFTQGFLALMAELFPRHPVTRLPLDHPLFLCLHKIEKVKYSPAAEEERPDGLPCLYGVDLGCRTAVFFSPYDMCCGWDSHEMAGASAVAIEDSQAIGMNLVAYSIAYARLGRFLSRTKIYYEKDQHARGDLVIGQLSYPGNWDPDPSALANLLKRARETSTVKVQFTREPVDPSRQELHRYPFLYLTGHDDFRWAPEEAKRLRTYLEAGGFLLADACCGRKAFDAAFRREIAAAVGEEVKPLELDHPVYRSLHAIQEARYAPLVVSTFKDPRVPLLEGIDVDGGTRVIYSRFGLGCGWENEDHPFTKAYLPEDSLKIGTNVLAYFLTH
ncbi:MAG: DUF4159 domain-containing protein [Planctomycetes bacterium]|nr:DUF4159 domain-containing protein [Planctomycetota bacterium]